MPRIQRFEKHELDCFLIVFDLGLFILELFDLGRVLFQRLPWHF